jgi:hypothetical protein
VSTDMEILIRFGRESTLRLLQLQSSTNMNASHHHDSAAGGEIVWASVTSCSREVALREILVMHSDRARCAALCRGGFRHSGRKRHFMRLRLRSADSMALLVGSRKGARSTCEAESR